MVIIPLIYSQWVSLNGPTTACVKDDISLMLRLPSFLRRLGDSNTVSLNFNITFVFVKIYYLHAHNY